MAVGSTIQINTSSSSSYLPAAAASVPSLSDPLPLRAQGEDVFIASPTRGAEEGPLAQLKASPGGLAEFERLKSYIVGPRTPQAVFERRLNDYLRSNKGKEYLRQVQAYESLFAGLSQIDSTDGPKRDSILRDINKANATLQEHLNTNFLNIQAKDSTPRSLVNLDLPRQYLIMTLI